MALYEWRKCNIFGVECDIAYKLTTLACVKLFWYCVSYTIGITLTADYSNIEKTVANESE